MKTIQVAILKTLAQFPVPFTEEDLEKLAVRIRAAKPDKPEQFAYVVVRNWAIDRRRRQERAVRLEATTLLKEAREREVRTRFAACCAEFDRIVARIVPTLPPTRIKWLGMVRLGAIEGVGDEECASRFPGSTQTTRWQWKHRGIQLLLPHSSPELRAVLTRRGWKR